MEQQQKFEQVLGEALDAYEAQIIKKNIDMIEAIKQKEAENEEMKLKIIELKKLIEQNKNIQ
tara:strand:+ start:202 stop:387 length:186 start_codon:yes stop_codon:yes gene_type:complete